MMTLAALEKIKRQQIGKLPVVILPPAQWQQVEAILKDYEIMRSPNYRKSVKEARR